MSALSNAAENDLIDLLYNATAWPNIADNAASSPIANFQDGLYESTGPGEAGNQTTNEADYTSYARTAIARSGSGWTVSGDTATLASAVSWPAATGGTNTITYWGNGRDSSSTGYLILAGAVTPNISVSDGVTPQLTTSTAVTAA